MLRSASCFRIIACVGDEEDRDKLGLADAAATVTESKGSYEKRRWSFRRKSSSQRVIIHTVVPDTSGNKDGGDLESTHLPATQLIAPEKSSVTQCNDEEINLSMKGDLISASVTQLDTLSNVNGSTVIPIQTAIRKSLAQGELAKLKKLVKLQAAVRGHLVRRHAVGSLHCIRAIVKMQALARARYGKSLDKSEIKEKVQEKYETTKEVDGDSASKVGVPHGYTSIDKVLYNSFAHQLLESTPNPKHLHIKCDPSSPSAAWLWMERWMSFASQTIDGSEFEIEQKQKLKEKNMPSHEEDGKVLDNYETCGAKFSIDGSGMNYLVSSAPLLTTHLPEDNKEELKPVNAANSIEIEASGDMVPEPNQNVQLDTELEAELKAPYSDSEIKAKPFDGKVSLEMPDMGGKNIICGSRKPTNPSFIAAQSKFKELSSTGSTVSYNPLHHDAEGEHDSKTDAAKTGTSITNGNKDFSQSDDSHKFTGGSECRTELSVTSTLDSLDGSYIELSEPRVLEDVGKVPDEGICNVIKDEALSSSNTPTFFLKEDKPDTGIKKSGDAKTDNKMVEKKLKRINSGVRVELKTEKNHRLSCSSVKDSPRSLVTSPGSQGTPSSQLVARSWKMKNTGSRKSTDFVSSGKKSSLSSAGDFSVSDNEQLHQKVDRRRSSFGSPSSDLFELERRDSSGSISMRSYMKPTVSAKAKLLASTSPRLSFDVYEKDVNHKKRHSLPVANGKEISPKLQQPPKGSGTLSQERKWQK
uniref:DUF4005 domain-containing protein n=1 Tax=Kalanchoe fedtschenkoi TaxID=63787 RepID=A0A7N0V2I8_KALFE